MPDKIESACTFCAHSKTISEIPGQFRDFDADRELHGTIGVPLCSFCLGTGCRIETPEFLSLGGEVSGIRSSNLRIQMKAGENEKWRIEVESNNQRLVEIAKKALEMVNEPVENCLAIKLVNSEWQ